MTDPFADPFTDWRSLQLDDPPGTAAHDSQRVRGGGTRTDRRGRPVPELLPGPAPHVDIDLDVARSIAVLDDPSLVVTPGHIGPERRRLGIRARFSRATWTSRRRLLRLDLLIVLALVAMVFGALLLTASSPSAPTSSPVHRATEQTPALAPVSVAGTPADAPRFGSRRPTTVPPTVISPTAVPPTVISPTAVPPAPPAPPVPAATTDAQAGATPGTPEAIGAAALALVRYPWQQLPGYSIVFRSIADAPSPGFYGNTTFTWGSTGGISTLYVYPGETVERLAGITAFEIAHEVDAAYVEPRGGHDAIESLLGIHPASWAPQCDCAEQGYLSGWYSAAFSDYWSPGVGAWSPLAPLPAGDTLIAMKPWLEPRVP